MHLLHTLFKNYVLAHIEFDANSFNKNNHGLWETEH